MALSVGDRLGRFEIVGALGAGGMGEVYRARDPQLQRDVAIKVLPAELSDDPVRRRRFEQEARAAGGLNHPNILAVYDVGAEGTCGYLVTELLEGRTLADALAEGPLPSRRAVDYARQIASGLAAAHDRGVVHRDIKPSNVFITTDGRVKILDFGLAKFVGVDAGVTETVSIDGDRRTSIIGSVGYMSPEQARGLQLDHRTDIFSLGVVLHEMVAGVAPFRRATSGDTLHAILHDEPPPLPRRDFALDALDPIVRHCLEKQPAERFQNARDLIFSLDAWLDAAAGTKRAPRGRAAQTAMMTVAALVGAAAAGAYFTSKPTSGATPAATDRAIYGVRTLTDFVGLEEFPAISPDGRMVAFTAVQGGRRQVFFRYIAEDPIHAVTTGDADHESPRWLPNASAVVYFSPAGPGEVQGTIFRTPVLGGPAQRVIPSIGGGDVDGKGRVACFRLEQGRIQLITSTIEGTGVGVIAELKTEHYGYPRWSPDGEWIAYQAGDGFRWDVYIVRARDGSTPTRISDDSKVIRGLSWLPDSSGVIYATARASTFPYLPPMTLWEASVTGRQQQVTSLDASYEQPDIHRDGKVSATRVRMRYEIREYPFDRVTATIESGRQVTFQTGQVATPTPAPKGGEVAYLSDTGGHANIWVTDVSGRARQVTHEENPEVAIGLPSWSPDGQWIAYLSAPDGLNFGVWLVKPDGSGARQLLSQGLSPAWSADSQWIYYVERANTSIKRVPVAGGPAEVVRKEPARNVIGVEGTTIFFVVDRALTDGRQEFEIHAATAGSDPARRVTTIPTSRVPTWQVVNPALSPDGKWLAMPLTDGFTTNIWAISTGNGQLRRVTDFGRRAVFITRRVSWSVDGRSLFAATGEGDTDIVLLDGLIRPGSGPGR